MHVAGGTWITLILVSCGKAPSIYRLLHVSITGLSQLAIGFKARLPLAIRHVRIGESFCNLAKEISYVVRHSG